MKLDAAYNSSLLKQWSIIQKAASFVGGHGVAPANIVELAKYGVAPADAVDPWGRAFRTRILEGHLIMVQSTGPSGRDALSSDHLGAASGRFNNKNVQLLGDNLIVTQDLNGPARRRR